VSALLGLGLGAAAQAEEGALRAGVTGAAAAVVATIAVTAALQSLGADVSKASSARERTTMFSALAAAAVFGAATGLTLADLSLQRRRDTAVGTGRAGVSRRR